MGNLIEPAMAFLDCRDTTAKQAEVPFLDCRDTTGTPVGGSPLAVVIKGLPPLVRQFPLFTPAALPPATIAALPAHEKIPAGGLPGHIGDRMVDVARALPLS